MRFTTIDENGFSLVELAVVLVVIGIMVGVVMESMTARLEDSRFVETEREMELLVQAIVGSASVTPGGQRSDFGYVGDVGAFPPDLQALRVNPGSYSTWDGPYFESRFAEDSLGFKLDGWGKPYTYTGGLTITSTGRGSPIEKKIADDFSDYLINSFSGTVTDVNGDPPGPDYADSVRIEITIPDGSGGTVTRGCAPGSGGQFTLDSLPVGTHSLQIIYRPDQDTLRRYLTILPRHKSPHTYVLVSTFGGAAPYGLTFEEYSEAKQSSNTNNVVVATPPGTSEGDLLIAAVVTDGDQTISPPGGEGWTQIAQNANGLTLGVWWKTAGAFESPSHEFTWSGNERSYAWIMRLTGHDPTSPIHASTVAGGASASPTCPSLNVSIASSLVLRVGGFDNDDIVVDNPGLSGHTPITMDESSATGGSCSGGAGHRFLAAPGPSGTADFSLTAAQQWRTVTVAIAPAP